MRTKELERYILSRNAARKKVETRIAQAFPAEEILDAVDQLQNQERSLCIAIILDKEDQVRDEIGNDSNPTDWHKGQLAMSRKCTISLDHSRDWQTFYRERNDGR